jgi:hypothetical protein
MDCHGYHRDALLSEGSAEVSDYNNDRLIELANDNARLRRDNERLLLKANSLSNDLREAEAELAEVKALWFADADPKETRFANEYAAADDHDIGDEQDDLSRPEAQRRGI